MLPSPASKIDLKVFKDTLDSSGVLLVGVFHFSFIAHPVFSLSSGLPNLRGEDEMKIRTIHDLEKIRHFGRNVGLVL